MKKIKYCTCYCHKKSKIDCINCLYSHMPLNMNLDLTQADPSEVESKKNWTPFMIMTMILITILWFRVNSISFHDQRREANRYLICITKNNTTIWEGKCFSIMWR